MIHCCARLIVIASLVSFTLSATANEFPDKYRDSNVSDAARQASGSRVIIPPAETESVDLRIYAPPPQVVASKPNESFDNEDRQGNQCSAGFGLEYWRIQYASSSLSEGRFYSFYYESLDRNRMNSAGFRLVYGAYKLPETGIVGDSIKSADSLSIEGYVKYYGNDILFIAAPYAEFSYGYGTMWWSYLQPITDSSGYTFSSDSLEFIELKAGLGGELGRYGVLQLSAYVGPVARIYLGRTTEGFNNDLFEDSLDMTWGATIGLRY